jgi:MFS family permease
MQFICFIISVIFFYEFFSSKFLLALQTRDFDWDSKMKGLLLSSFFYGYIITQIPGGWLAARVGGNRVFGIGIAVTAFLTLLTPPLTYVSVYLLLAVRIVEGIFEVSQINSYQNYMPNS